MNTLFITIALFVNFVHPVNHGQQRAAAQPVAIVHNVNASTEATCNEPSTVEVPAPVLADYLDDATPYETAVADWQEDLAWWYVEFNVCH